MGACTARAQMIFPAVYALRTSIFPTLPYKVRGRRVHPRPPPPHAAEPSHLQPHQPAAPSRAGSIRRLARPSHGRTADTRFRQHDARRQPNAPHPFLSEVAAHARGRGTRAPSSPPLRPLLAPPSPLLACTLKGMQGGGAHIQPPAWLGSNRPRRTSRALGRG